MKKATYTLVIEFDNGDKLRVGGITQTKAYGILKKWEDRFWFSSLTANDGTDLSKYVVRWKLDTGWQEIND